MQLIVTVPELNKRSQVPPVFPHPETIIGVVLEGFRFEGEPVDIDDIPNPAMGTWYRDRDGYYYWGGGLMEDKEAMAPPSETSPREVTVPTAAPEFDPAKMGWGLKKLQIDEFWNKAENKGENILIAILDTGIVSGHPDFDYSRITRHNILLNNSDAEDHDGHGTHVAGIIAAQGQSIVGVAPKTDLLVVKVAERPSAWNSVKVADGIKYAMDQGADIISISGEFDAEDSNLALLKQKVEEAHIQGISIIASAGNNFNDFPIDSFPAAFDQCISVGSIKPDGTRADNSSLSEKLDVVAPGEMILSTWLNGQYKELSGTSMATPFTAGIVAVLKSYAKAKLQRDLLPGELQILITKSADDAGDHGIDIAYGFGIVNPNKAIQTLFP